MPATDVTDTRPMRFLAFAVLALAVPGCGLTLDYDPPTDAGGTGLDAPPADVGRIECTTDLECDDDDACTGVEQCIGGICSPGEDVDCDDDDVCDGTETCDSATGECSPGAPLDCVDDGDVCNGIEQCEPELGCVPVAALSCDDGVDCTVDDCDPELGCFSTPVDTLCTEGAEGVCDPLTDCSYRDCDDSWCNGDNPCVPSHCDGEGVCVREPVVCGEEMDCCMGDCVPRGCEDGNPCTTNRCTPGVGCTEAPTVGPCDDGIACTGMGRCMASTCMRGRDDCGGVVPQCHEQVCDDASGECVLEPRSGERCDDDDACTLMDMCIGGSCLSTAVAICDDANECTSDVCTAIGGCRYESIVDEEICTTSGGLPGTCVRGVCQETSICADGTGDCDGDGDCECLGRCIAIAIGMQRCIPSISDCTILGCGPGGSLCCTNMDAADYATCYPDDCTGCCTIR